MLSLPTSRQKACTCTFGENRWGCVGSADRSEVQQHRSQAGTALAPRHQGCPGRLKTPEVGHPGRSQPALHPPLLQEAGPCPH